MTGGGYARVPPAVVVDLGRRAMMTRVEQGSAMTEQGEGNEDDGSSVDMDRGGMVAGIEQSFAIPEQRQIFYEGDKDIRFVWLGCDGDDFGSWRSGVVS